MDGVRSRLTDVLHVVEHVALHVGHVTHCQTRVATFRLGIMVVQTIGTDGK